MNNNTIFETGATTHAVNDLILYTDNTRELAELRDHIYKGYLDGTGDNPTVIAMSELYRAAKGAYIKEFGRSNSLHIVRLTTGEVTEYCNLYVKEFNNWKQEHGY